MFQRRRPYRKRYRTVMDSYLLTPPRSRFWLVIFILFFFWYVLLYGFDWSSLPGLSSLSHRQETFNQSINLEHKNISGEQKSDLTVKNISRNATADPVTKPAVKPVNISSADNDVIDLEELEKELEPLLPKEEPRNSSAEGIDGVSVDTCVGKYIYIHNISSRFNENLIKNCKLLNKWHDMCRYLENDGLGRDLDNTQNLFMPTGWYVTNQFSLEVIFHQRMKQYNCLTNDSSQASAVFVPYYPGLDISRHLFGDYNTSVKDADSLELYKWLRARTEWSRMGGKDHFLVAGRITWDFRRLFDKDSEWGSKVMLLPESQNMTMLTIESSPWNKNDFAIPYPTYFHPSTDAQVQLWQSRMKVQKRRYLFCFAGGPRPDMDDSIRGEIMRQCGASRRCRLLQCIDNKENCLQPENLMKLFENSIFCLQPPGDSFTRRSTFDSFVAGCIPVFFNPASAYVQYLWHLPKDYPSYSVLISERDVKNRKLSIDRVLSQISRTKISAMRDRVIDLIPNVIYADPRSGLEKIEDAFDLTIKGVLQRIEGLRKEEREGKNNSDAFDEESSWKYYTFGTTKPHPWDPYFKRKNRLQE